MDGREPRALPLGRGGAFRALLAALAPAALKLQADFDTSGRTGVNFSRINRDIRFARDKTPYRPQMYLTFPDPAAAEEGGRSSTWAFRARR